MSIHDDIVEGALFTHLLQSILEQGYLKTRLQQSQHVLDLIASRAEVQSFHLRKPGRKIDNDITRSRVAEKDIGHSRLDLALLQPEQHVKPRTGKVKIHHSDPVMQGKS